MTYEQLKLFLTEAYATVVEAMQKIDTNAKGILFIVDHQGKIAGVVTDGDIRRWLIKTGDLSAPIAEFENKNPKVVYENNLSDAKELMDKFSINALPVIDNQNVVVDILFRAEEMEEFKKKDKKTLKDVPVIIMAGGKGTRLYPYTKILPKPLIPIGDIPIMERIIDRFHDFGVERFWATVNYKKNMIKSYFAELTTDYSLDYVEEDKPLGTAGSLHLIKEKFEVPVIVSNCDILIQADYADIYKYHMESENDLTIVTALKNIVVPYGVIHSKEEGKISSMEEKPKLSYFVNTGMYVLSPKALERIPKDTFFHMTDLADMLLQEGEQVGMYPISEESFLDMGEFEEMHRMEQKLHIKAE